MIGLDTNVLVHYFADDEPKQARVVDSLLAAPNSIVERRAPARRALQAFAAAAGAGFNDCLIGQINAEAGCRQTLTFDRRAAKISGFDLLN